MAFLAILGQGLRRSYKRMSVYENINEIHSIFNYNNKSQCSINPIVKLGGNYNEAININYVDNK